MSVNEREAALVILEDIFKSAYNNLALKNYFKNNAADLTVSQKRFITETVNGVLRNYIYLDFCASSYINGKVRLKPFIRHLLRVSSYQIIFMATPDYAVINEAVGLCRKRGFNNLCAFVNAVLRKIASGKNNLPLPDESAGKRALLSITYSVPEWIVDMWLDEYGYDTCADICKAQSERPCVTICVNTLKTTKAALTERLAADGVKVMPSHHENALKITNTSDISNLGAFKAGLFHVMDISAMTAVDLLGAASGSDILDVCAAPGGKSFYMAQKYGANVTACDIYPHKIELIKKSRDRLGLGGKIGVLSRDAAVFHGDFAERFDFCLVDAPCSGLGIIKKKPDIKLSRSPSDIADLSCLQYKILKNSSGYVKTGGTLLYCTCTLSKRENRDVVDLFLSGGAFSLKRDEEILPSRYGSDGFYIAVMTKNERDLNNEGFAVNEPGRT